jgi:hypothetical protein
MNVHDHHKDESVLVIVLAETRAHEFTFDLFKKNVLDVVNGDLCVCVADNEREEKANPFYQHAKYMWKCDERDDWGDAIDMIRYRRKLDLEWRQLLKIKNQWLGGVKGEGAHPGSAGILLFFRMFLSEMIVEHGVLEQYDRFIITRSDFVHRVPHVPLKYLDAEYIWIPDGEDYGGYTDRHVVVDRSDILDVLSIGDRILTAPEELFKEMAHSSRWNLERYIKHSFTRLGLISKVRRFPYSMYSVKSHDGHTRWAAGQYSNVLGYNIKYKSEYEKYLTASMLVSRSGHWTRPKIILYNFLTYLLTVRSLARYVRALRRRVRRLRPYTDGI